MPLAVIVAPTRELAIQVIFLFFVIVSVSYF